MGIHKYGHYSALGSQMVPDGSSGSLAAGNALLCPLDHRYCCTDSGTHTAVQVLLLRHQIFITPALQ